MGTPSGLYLVSEGVLCMNELLSYGTTIAIEPGYSPTSRDLCSERWLRSRRGAPTLGPRIIIMLLLAMISALSINTPKKSKHINDPISFSCKHLMILFSDLLVYLTFYLRPALNNVD
jgi:hypothetical protein